MKGEKCQAWHFFPAARMGEMDTRENRTRVRTVGAARICVRPVDDVEGRRVQVWMAEGIFHRHFTLIC